MRALLALWIPLATLIALQERPQPPLLVGGDVEKPKRTHFVQPVYPEEAQASAVQSLVILEITVDGTGGVTEVRPLRGSDAVVSAAVEAATQWRYEPTFVDGEPVSLRFSETFAFVLRKPPPVSDVARGGSGMYLRPGAPGATSDSYEDWDVEGEAFTACPCTTPCPCRSNAPPSHAPCHATTTQHFTRGHYGDVDLSGMTYVTLGPETWTAVYFDESSTPAQRQAVLDLYASMVPGAPQVYRAVKTVPIVYEVGEGRLRKHVQIPGILEVESRMRSGSDLMSAIGMDVWSNRLFYGYTGVYRFDDPELGESWDHSDRQSNHKIIQTSKRMYDERRMLIQHGDGSGSWTPPQRRIIACLR